MPLTPAETDTYIEYNGFKFPQYLKISVKAQPTPTFGNRANRNLVMNLTLETMITYDILSTDHSFGPGNVSTLNSGSDPVVALTSGDKLDAPTPPLMRKLLEKGKRLVVKGLGLGDIDINSDSVGTFSTPDLDNGPTPQIVDLTNFTNARAYRLVWSVTFTVTPCGDRYISKTKATVDGFDFTIHYGITPNGMMSRTITGRITVPNWIKNNQTAIALDPLKTKIDKAFPIPQNYNRNQYFHHSENRTQLSFTLTDTQIDSGNAYPAGLSHISAQHSASLSKLHAATFNEVSLLVQMTISGTLTLNPGIPKDYAWLVIVNLLLQKVSTNVIPLVTPTSGSTPANVVPIKNSVIACGFSITDGLFDRTVSFSFSYTMPLPLKYFWKETNMFKPLSYTWKEWAEFRNQKPWGYDGELTFDPKNQKDYVITVCDTSDSPTKDPQPIDVENPDVTYKVNDSNYAFFNSSLKTQVTEETSYLSFFNKVEQHSDYNVAVVGVIGDGDAAQYPEAGTTSEPFASRPLVDGQALKIQNGMEGTPLANTAQQRGTGKHYVVLKGSGRRVRYPVQIPGINSLGEDQPIPILLHERLEASHLVGYTADGVAIYGATWHRVYCLPGIQDRTVSILNLAAIDHTPIDPSFRLT